MDRHIVKYLPWMAIVVLLVVSGVVIYARGGFENEKIAGADDIAPSTSPGVTPIDSPIDSPTPSLSPSAAPLRAPAAAPLITTPIPLGTIPSINRVGRGDD